MFNKQGAAGANEVDLSVTNLSPTAPPAEKKTEKDEVIKDSLPEGVKMVTPEKEVPVVPAEQANPLLREPEAAGDKREAPPVVESPPIEREEKTDTFSIMDSGPESAMTTSVTKGPASPADREKEEDPEMISIEIIEPGDGENLK